MSLNFCSQENRCPICGGALDEYELRHKHPFHLNKDKCITVLQNTLTGLSENDEHIFKMLSHLIRDFTQEQIDELERAVERE